MRSASLALRALLALALLVGFYVLALGTVAALLAIPAFEVFVIHRIHLQITLLCLVGAGVVGWSLLPRIDRFRAPGALLSPDAHPRLFQELRDVADRTGQAMPREVYLVPAVNAFVTTRGGVLGIGSRRVMGLGLPLLQALTVPQLRAVIAHEFGHFHGGDTALGPLIYRTRDTIGRTVQSLAATQSGLLAIVQLPFHAYLHVYLRLTLAISRAQEYAADALAARVQGGRPLIDGLRRVHAATLAYDAYVRTELGPLVDAGYRPPIAAGFHRFMAVDGTARRLDALVDQEIETAKPSAYDSHPALRDRIAAVEALHVAPGETDGPAAIDLLEDVARFERETLRFMLADPGLAERLKDVSWEAVGATVTLPAFRERLAPFRSRFHGPIGALVVNAATLLEHGDAFVKGKTNSPLSTVQRTGLGVHLIEIAVTVALADAGWAVESLPGQPVRLVHDGAVFEPGPALRAVAEREPPPWSERCAAAGVSDVPFAPPPSAG